MRLITPKKIKSDFPVNSLKAVKALRERAVHTLLRKDPTLALIVGPCSIHDPDSALDYAKKLRKLSSRIYPRYFPIMRVFFEKPRSCFNWKGYIYDPYLDGSNQLLEGIVNTRKLLIEITEMGIACAAELLEPLLAPYFDDLLVWGFIGARTSGSQLHRQLASSLAFPVGFKNDCSGNVEVAVSGVYTAAQPHSHVGIDEEGKISQIKTSGNPLSHLVLRGSDKMTNFDPDSIESALKLLKKYRSLERVLIDCSHGNSGKDAARQKEAFYSVLSQAETRSEIVGVMLESHLFAGKQSLQDPENLSYGVSITDSCIGWEETEELLLSTSMSFVQK